MKFLKVFSVLALSAMTLNLSAALNAKAQLFFESEEAITNYLISQDDAVANDFTSPNCGKVSSSTDPYAIRAYTLYNSQKYAAVELNDINGVEVVFEPNQYETSYTLTISDVEGDVKVMLGDQEVVSPYVMTGITAPVTFTIVMPQPVAKDYTRDAATVIGNWYTICVPGGVDATEYAPVMDVYTVGGYNATQGLAVDPMTEAMQPGVPYIFLAKATQIAFDYNGATEALDPKGGEEYKYLTGTFEDMQTENVAYVVANNKLNWAAAGTIVPAYRAYLAVEDITELPVANNAPGRKFLPAPKGVATNLEGAIVNGLQNGTYMVNGQIVIVKDGKTFNVLGL